MDDPLRDALVVEVGDLLAEDEILEQRRPAQAGLQRVLVVGDGDAHVRGHRLPGGVDANAVERPVARVVADDRLAFADLVGHDVLGDGAGGIDLLVRRHGLAGLGRVAVVEAEL